MRRTYDTGIRGMLLLYSIVAVPGQCGPTIIVLYMTLMQKTQQHAYCKTFRIKSEVWTLYKEYDDNPHMILPTHSHLFTSRIMTQQLKHNYDNLTCWLRSVSEAKLDLVHHVRQL